MRRLDLYDNRAFDRGAGRCREALWVGVRLIFFQTAVPWPSWWKAWWLRVFGARVGKGVVVRTRITITFPWRLEVGDHVWIGDEVYILNLDWVRIQSHACVSQRAFLCTGSHDHRRATFDLITKPIELEEGCWVGAQAFVGPGVTIGRGAVVGAGEVVKRDVPGGEKQSD